MRINAQRSGVYAFLTVALLCPSWALAGTVTVFSNLPGSQSAPFPPYCIGGNNPGCAGIDYQPAFEFTAADTGYLTEVGLDVYSAGNPEGSAVVSLMTNNGGLPGSVLEQWIVTPGGDSVYTLASVLNPLLTSGGDYWLAASNTLGSGGVIGWDATTTSDTGPYADMKTGSWAVYDATADQGAFEILADTVNHAVPEPSSLVLLGAGIAGFFGARMRIGRRNKNNG